MGFDAAVIFIFMAIVDNSNEHLQRQISLKDRTSRFSSARSPRNGRQPIFKIEFVMALIKGLFFVFGMVKPHYQLKFLFEITWSVVQFLTLPSRYISIEIHRKRQNFKFWRLLFCFEPQKQAVSHRLCGTASKNCWKPVWKKCGSVWNVSKTF